MGGQVSADRLMMVDRIINYFFLLDVCLNFRTGYFDKEGNLAMDWSRICKHYLTTWFLLDIVSSIPFEELSSGNMIDLQAAKLLKLGKLARVAKMLTEASDVTSRIEDWMDSKLIQNLQRRGSVLGSM